jgi:DNA-directed RNA polymerase subunit RPC12/RpoP
VDRFSETKGIPELSASGESPIFPWHPQPAQDEAFSCWFLRLASGCGTSADALSKILSINSRELSSADDWHPSSTSTARKCADIISKATGIPAEKIRLTLLPEVAGLMEPEDVGPCRNLYFPVLDHPWITRSSLPPLPLCFKGEFCPQCLQSAPLFCLSWRISLFVSCSFHGCLLHGKCQDCGAPFQGLDHFKRLDLSDNFEDLIVRCRYCSKNLGLGNSTMATALPEVRDLEAFHRAMVRNPLMRAYFSAVHSMLDIASEIGSGSQQVREVSQSSEHPIGFASCGAAERQRRLRVMTDLFIDWPDAFVSAGSRFLRAPRRIAPRAPTWFTAALRAARGDRGEIRTARLEFWSAAKAEGWLEAAYWLTRHNPYEQWWITR